MGEPIGTGGLDYQRLLREPDAVDGVQVWRRVRTHNGPLDLKNAELVVSIHSRPHDGVGVLGGIVRVDVKE